MALGAVELALADAERRLLPARTVLRWRYLAIPVRSAPGDSAANGGERCPQDPPCIVGASLGGARAAEALRDGGFEGQVVLIGAEEHYPYERPPLSKGYLQGSDERKSIFVHDDDWYAANAIDLRLGTSVTGIDRDLRQVALASGKPSATTSCC